MIMKMKKEEPITQKEGTRMNKPSKSIAQTITAINKKEERLKQEFEQLKKAKQELTARLKKKRNQRLIVLGGIIEQIAGGDVRPSGLSAALQNGLGDALLQALKETPAALYEKGTLAEIMAAEESVKKKAEVANKAEV